MPSAKKSGEKSKLSAKNLSVFYGNSKAIDNVNINILEKNVTAFIGPSGCGKSTFLRCFNIMNDTIQDCKIV